MFDTNYNINSLTVGAILGLIEAGTIAIPEIQRPFVWKRSKVRDLIDSMYNGYPTGYIIRWQSPNVKIKNGGESAGKFLLIDGQQRITALMTSILGIKIIDEDYQERVIKIAFNPMAKDDEERFAVQDQSHIKSSKWIEDISILFKPEFSQLKFIRKYCEENPEADEDELSKSITRLISIKNIQVGVVDLGSNLNIDEVTEIFVRINSQGKPLKEADFAMSKIAADEELGGNILRKTIDYFCHIATDPNFYNYIVEKDNQFAESEFAPKVKWLANEIDDIYDPDYNDMLRVSFAHKFGRGKLGQLVSLLSGRDFEARDYKKEIKEESFKLLKEGIENFINEYNFKQFVLAIKSAGFISNKMINSKMTLDFAYILFLMLHESNEVDKTEIKRYVQKWYVMAILTGRYVSSPESWMDKDIREIKAKGFKNYFRELEDAELSDTFWTIGLVQALETTASNSPYFSAYLAAQVYRGENALFSKAEKVADLISIAGDIHHIFPKEYLKQNGYNDKVKYNQVANYTYLDRPVNIKIGKDSPEVYFRKAFENCYNGEWGYTAIASEYELKENLKMNCIPEDICKYTIDRYEEFLLNRRKMMAKKIEEYYKSL